MTIAYFIIGLMTGACIGIVTAGILAAAKCDGCRVEMEVERRARHES